MRDAKARRRVSEGGPPGPARVEFRYLLSQVWGEPRDLKLSGDEMAARRDGRVRAIVRFAYENVPWYRGAMRARGLDPADVRTADDLALLPVVEHEDLSSDGVAFLPRDADPGGFLALPTSGSTMIPRTIFHDDEALVAGWAVKLRERAAREWHMQGDIRNYRTASLTLEGGPTRIRDRFRATVPAVWKLAPEELQISVFEDCERVVEELTEWRPRVLAGYGSAIGRLFRHLAATGACMPLPEVVSFGSDSLAAGERTIVEEEFGLPVLGIYGSTEAMAIGFECGRGEGYHVHEDVTVVRIVDAAGRAVAPGEPGSVLVSNLVNRGTVLLNARLGDVATPIEGACPCGRSLPRIRLLDGRDAAWIERDGALPVHQYHLFRRLKALEISRWQVVQRGSSDFLVRIIPAVGQQRERLGPAVRDAMADLFGPELEIGVEFPPDLERTPNGKVLSFLRRDR
jgi:phenylacetate-CoA ligase